MNFIIDKFPMENFYTASTSFESILWVIVFFGGSIFVHELGHFWAAKCRKLFVPRFSIGFGPLIFSKKIGETEFCLSLLPLGGYVALPQLMDAKEIEGKYELPKNTREITTIDKVIVSSMGAIFNLIFAFFLGIALWHVGIERNKSYLSNVVGYVQPKLPLPGGKKMQSPAKLAGIEIGDRIVEIDGHSISNFNDILQGIALGKNRDATGPISILTIVRDGTPQTLTLHPVLSEQNTRTKESLRTIGIEPAQELVIASIYANSPAEKLGLKRGDRLISSNHVPLLSFSQFNDILEKNNEVTLTLQRKSENLEVSLPSYVFASESPYLKLTTEFGILEVFPKFSNDTIFDLYKDHCSLMVLSMDTGVQKVFPELNAGSEISKIRQNSVTNLADSIFIFQNTSNVPMSVTIDGKDWKFIVEKAELISPHWYKTVGFELDETKTLVHENPFSQIYQSAYSVFLTLGSLISPASDVHFKNLMGPPGILKTLHTFALHDFRLLLWLVITLNVNLAIFNLLPLPILDGGIIALALLEKLLRRKISTKTIASIQLLFMFALLGLIIYISFFDVNRIIGEQDAKERRNRAQKLYIGEQRLWNGISAHQS